MLLLGLGIGGATSTFALLDRLLLTPLPYPEPDRLVGIWVDLPGASSTRFSGPGAADFVDEVQAVQAGRFYGSGLNNVDFGDGPESIVGVGVGPETLDVYGVRPLVGRTFRPGDKVGLTSRQMRDPTFERPLGAMVISHRLWRNRLGADPDVVGTLSPARGTRASNRWCHARGVSSPQIG